MGLADRLWGQELSLKSLAQIKDELNIVIQDIIRINPAVKIILFGSTAQGSATLLSDFDIAVILSDQINKKLFIKEFYKTRTLIKTPVDFIFRNHSEFSDKQENNMIDQEIFKTGLEIYPQWTLND